MTKQQERDRARRRYLKRQATQAQRATDTDRARRLGVMGAVIVVVAAVLAALGSLFATVAPQPQLTAAGCEAPPTPLGTGAKLQLPDKGLAAGKTYTATVTTNCGDLVLELDGSRAPQAVSSFLQLAQSDYWLNAPCHRLVKSSPMTVLQCGDPTGTGQGTPGYGYAVENAPGDGVYVRGTVAMARSSDAQTGNGGQFFLVDQKTTLPDPAGYTVFGHIVQGLDIVDRIVAAGVVGGSDVTDGAPVAPISILRVAVTEKKA